MMRYFLLLLLSGCCVTSQPVQVSEGLIRLEKIEVKYRYGGDIAFLYWYNAIDKQTYLQAIAACDTVKYKPGMLRVEFIQR